MNKKQKRHIIASAGTVLFMMLVFLLLWFVYLTATMPEQEEGIEVAFGEVKEAGGYMAQQSEAAPLPTPQPAAPIRPTQPAEEKVLTSEDLEALAMQEAQKKREAEEKARLDEEKRKQEKEEVERKKAQDLISGINFGNSGNETGSGNSEGEGRKGNTAGHGSSGDNNWSLDGRDLKGTLPQPANSFKQAGKVVVQIRVNAAGQVIDARETAGGNISDKQTVQLALEAARKAKFTEGDHDQIGTITYIFKLN